MTSAVQAICDAIVADLTDNVPGLADVTTHLYVPWVPEEGEARAGERHLGVWVIGDSTVPLTSDAHEPTTVYGVSVWEEAGDAQARKAQDVPADLEFLELAQAVKSRFYVQANQWLGGSEKLWYAETSFLGSSTTSRRFDIVLNSVGYDGFS